jgi:hypothetical protein
VGNGTIDAARRAVGKARVGGAAVMLTGQDLLEHERQSGGPPSFLSETVLAGVAALGVLAFVSHPPSRSCRC